MQKEKRKDRIIQIIGELILYSPILIIAYYLQILPSCLLSMCCVFIFKHFFYYSLHLNKWYGCITLSYTLFLLIGVLERGLGITIPYLDNQPMLIVLCCIGIAYLNHYAGLWQKKLHSKSIWEMSENELRAYCKLKGIKRDRIDFVVYVVIYQWHFPEIAVKLGYALDTIKDWSEICKKKLNIKSWDVDKQ